MKFGTPPHIKDMFTQPLNTTADNVNTFALTEEERAYVCSIDAQQLAAKEALEAVIETAQATYEKNIARIALMKDNFLTHLADKHKVKRNKNSSVMPLEGLYVVDATKDKVVPTTTPAATAVVDILSATGSIEALTKQGFDACRNAVSICDITDRDEFASIIRYVFNKGPLDAALMSKLQLAQGLLDSICACTAQLEREGADMDVIAKLLSSPAAAKEGLNQFLVKTFRPGLEAGDSQQCAMLIMMGMIHYLFMRFVDP
jgi:hypothetical protein